jgi:hypothetical protein
MQLEQFNISATAATNSLRRTGKDATVDDFLAVPHV